jgi:hypothetical protein
VRFGRCGLRGACAWVRRGQVISGRQGGAGIGALANGTVGKVGQVRYVEEV